MLKRKITFMISIMFVSLFLFAGTSYAWDGSYWLIGGGFQQNATSSNYYDHVYKYDGTNTPASIYQTYYRNSYGQVAITDIQWNGSYWLIGVVEGYGSSYYSRVYKYTYVIYTSSNSSLFNCYMLLVIQILLCYHCNKSGFYFNDGSYWLIEEDFTKMQPVYYYDLYII
jgi:hypothetical protein